MATIIKCLKSREITLLYFPRMQINLQIKNKRKRVKIAYALKVHSIKKNWYKNTSYDNANKIDPIWTLLIPSNNKHSMTLVYKGGVKINLFNLETDASFFVFCLFRIRSVSTAVTFPRLIHTTLQFYPEATTAPFSFPVTGWASFAKLDPEACSSLVTSPSNLTRICGVALTATTVTLIAGNQVSLW